MRGVQRVGIALGLLAVGYLLGAGQAGTARPLRAQDEAVPSDEAAKRIQDAYEAVRSAQSALEQEGLYRPAITGINPYLVLAGGGDAVADLESGKGVDPITFAGLYAGNATEEVEGDLGRDSDGRLTYKNRVVRIYSIAKLQRVHADQLKYSGTTVEDSNPFGTP